MNGNDPTNKVLSHNQTLCYPVTMPRNVGHATTQAVTSLSEKKLGFENRSVHVQFAVKRVALEQAFL